MKISLIAAIGKNRELGRDNKLLWNIPEDLQRFKEITNGHPIIMGRKTFDSIGRVLPNRTSIVITRDPQSVQESLSYMKNSELVKVASSLDEAIDEAAKAPGNEEIFIIGGGQIFELAMRRADKLYLTLVEKSYPDADAYFPKYGEFSVVESKKNSTYDGLSFIFLDLKKPV